ncbi:hypothetical protein vseg_015916 [Gypsophila vaccaria]
MSGGSRGVYDASKLHLKKELTQIRRASKVLCDPGTNSSWKSPLSSSRSVRPSVFNTSHHYRHHNAANVNANDSAKFDGHLTCRNDVGKEKRVFLYNWRSSSNGNNKSSSEKSLGRFDLDGGGVNGGVGDVNDGSSVGRSVVSASGGGGGGGEESLSDGGHAGGDSKSDTCVGDYTRQGISRTHHHRCYSTTFRCRDTRVGSMLSPNMARRGIGKKGRKNVGVGGGGASSSVLLKQQLQKQKKQQRGVGDRKPLNLKRGLGSLVLSQDDSVSLVDQSDDTESFCVSEELRRVQAESPLLSRLRHRHRFSRGSRRDDSSYTLSTPALSTGSFSRFALANCRNPSTVGSWDETSSFNDVDNEEDPLDFPGRHGCGIWSKKMSKHKGSCRSCYSPSLSDTLRRTGGRLLCGSRKEPRKRHRSLSRSKKQRIHSQMAQGQLPLLDNSYDEVDSSLASGNSDDELSTNFGELNLEGLSRLDGRRWSSSCKSHEALDLMAVGKDGEEESSPENIRSFSQRYRPIFFDELIGQNMVVQSLMNSVSRGRVAAVYLFQGPRGTGKTSTAKIFATALNCLATEGTKPCGICRECTDFISGRSKDLLEVDGTNKKAIDRARYVLKSLSIAPSTAFSRYKILLIDECHLLPSKTWLAFLKFLEEPLPRVVFIFVTTDLENVPRTVLSRCQKYSFNKIKESDIVSRLRKIAAEENLDVDNDALDLIALNADGSLRDAETMLDQLSLLGKTISTTLVNELVGVIPDNKLLELLELAMSSNTGETVKRARELMDSGVDPLLLMSQLASLIMDIIAGSYQLADSKCSDSPLGGRSLSDTELEKLKHALKLLSDSEKQLRVSSERSTWFTATLLQLGSVTSPEFTPSGSSKKQSSKTTADDPSTTSGRKQASDALYNMRRSASPPSFAAGVGACDSKATNKRSLNSIDSAASHDDFVCGSMTMEQANKDALDDIWLQCIERCHSKTLRQLLHSHGKLISLAEVDGTLTAYITFGNEDVKSRAERFLISITNSIEMVLRRSVEVRLILLPDNMTYLGREEPVGTPNSSGPKQIKAGNLNDCKGKSNVGPSSSLLDDRSSSILASDNTSNIRRQEIPMQRIESIIREQRLESAWLQAAERSTPRSMSRLRPEKNQVLPQDSTYGQSQVELANTQDLSSSHWEDELNLEIKALKISDGKNLQKDQISERNVHLPLSPSLLHQSGFASNLGKEYQGYESGPGSAGCNMLFCWNTRHPRKPKVNQGMPVRSHKGRHFLCFGKRRKSRRS